MPGSFVRIKLASGGYTDVPISGDASTHAMQTISREESQINAGNHYFVEDVADLSINSVFDVQWTTPNTTEYANFIFVIQCEAETEWYIYEGVTINTPGTEMTPHNNNRNSANTSNAALASISNSSVANANLDTAVAAATELAHGIVGAGRNGGIDQRERKIIFKQNTNYCMRAIANAAGYTNFLMEWDESTALD